MRILTIALFVNTLGSCLAKDLFRDWARTNLLARCQRGRGVTVVRMTITTSFLDVDNRTSEVLPVEVGNNEI